MERAVLQRVCAACTAFPAHQMHYGSVVVCAEPQKGKQKDIAHGRSNAERQLDMTEADERTMIAEVTQSLAQYTGQRPAGWLSPYLTPSRAFRKFV